MIALGALHNYMPENQSKGMDSDMKQKKIPKRRCLKRMGEGSAAGERERDAKTQGRRGNAANRGYRCPDVYPTLARH